MDLHKNNRLHTCNTDVMQQAHNGRQCIKRKKENGIQIPVCTHPPSPVTWGLTTPKQNTAATAASTALPPFFMMSVPTSEHTALSVATLP